MKKLMLLIALSISTTVMYAQTDTAAKVKYWKFTGNVQLLLNQSAYYQWAVGGENTLGYTGIADLSLNYKKNKNIWENRLYLALGNTRQGNIVRKNEDKIDFNSKYGREIGKNLYWSTQFNFLSQFINGYNYPNDSLVVSKFMAPAFFFLGTGIDYRPVDFLTITFQPLAARITWVTDTNAVDQTQYGILRGSTTRNQLGALLNIAIEKEIMKNMNLRTDVSLYSDYLDNPQNLLVKWNFKLDMAINEWFAASIITELIYDDRVLVPKKGAGDVITYGPGVQFKELLGIGLTYTIK
jgi:DUF3078 family protein